MPDDLRGQRTMLRIQLVAQAAARVRVPARFDRQFLDLGHEPGQVQRIAEREIDFRGAFDAELVVGGDMDDVQARSRRRQHGKIGRKRVRKTCIDPALLVGVEALFLARRDRFGQVAAQFAHARVVAIHRGGDVERGVGMIENPARGTAQRIPDHEQRVDLRVAIDLAVQRLDAGP